MTTESVGGRGLLPGPQDKDEGAKDQDHWTSTTLGITGLQDQDQRTTGQGPGIEAGPRVELRD